MAKSFNSVKTQNLISVPLKMLSNKLHSNGFFHFYLQIISGCAHFRQTTSVTRVGGPGGLLKVRVEIDKLGDLKLKISDLFGGRKVIGSSNSLKSVLILMLLML